MAMPEPPVEASPANQRLEALRRYVRPLVIAVVLGSLLLLPFRIIGYNYLPADDALRHAAKVVSGKPWHDILVFRDGVPPDSHPGWHALLGAVHSGFGDGTDTLVVFSLVFLCLLFCLPPLLVLRRPEAWPLVLLALALLAWPLMARLFYGRPYILSMAVMLLWALLWRKLDTPRLDWRWAGLFTTLLALSTWIHCTWYLLVLPVAALAAGQAWRAAFRLAGCTIAGVFVGACLTGQPVAFLWSTFHHLLWSFGNSEVNRMLVSEFQPHDGDPALVILALLLLGWRQAQGRTAAAVLRDPVFLMAVMGWILGLAVRRFWLDWGLPAFLVWAALEVQELLDRAMPADAWRRLGLTVAGCAALYLMVTHDSGSRWTKCQETEYLSTENADHAPWLPEPGGIFYSDNMFLFYQTFYANPKAPWRYILGYEAGLMPPEDLAIFRDIQRRHAAYAAYEPWVRKMRPEDRLVLSLPEGNPPGIAGLQWHYTARHIWIGRLPR